MRLCYSMLASVAIFVNLLGQGCCNEPSTLVPLAMMPRAGGGDLLLFAAAPPAAAAAGDWRSHKIPATSRPSLPAPSCFERYPPSGSWAVFRPKLLHPMITGGFPRSPCLAGQSLKLRSSGSDSASDVTAGQDKKGPPNPASAGGPARIVPVPRRSPSSKHKPPRKKRETSFSKILARKSEFGSLSEGLDTLEYLINTGANVNAKMFTVLLSICTEQIRLGYASFNDAKMLMEKCTECGVEQDTFLFNAFMSACAKAAARGQSSLSDGSRILQEMRMTGCSPDIITFNSLMDICAKAAGLVQSSTGDAPITTMTGYSVLKLIKDEGLQANCVTYATLMQLCAKCAGRGRASVQDGLQVLDRARASNVELNIWVYNSLMDLVAKSSSLGQADSLDGLAVLKRLRDEGLKPDTTTYNSLLEVYVHCASRGSKTLNDGLQIIQAMRSEEIRRDVTTYNTLLDLLAKETLSRGSARIAEGNALIAVMKADSVRPDLQTYSTLIDICTKATEHGVGDLGDADQVLIKMKEDGILDLDKVICNSYLNCAKADGSPAALVAADKILDIMPLNERDSYAYSSIIGLLGRTGDYNRAKEMFEEARRNIPRLNVFIYNAIMSVHSQQGNYGEVLELWQRMQAEKIKEDSVTIQHVKVAKEAANSPWER